MMWVTLMLYTQPMTKDVGDMKNDVKALEFFLQDKKDKEEHCPKLKWEQPKIEEYKKDPKSHLPKECKEESD